jgi:hypothetical protein
VITSPSDTTPRSGITYFMVRPYFLHGVFQAALRASGYVSANGLNLMFPAVAVAANGQGVIAFSASGPNMYPSAGYIHIQDGAHPGTIGRIHISGAGVGPDDGFTGYPQETGVNYGRWGDYGAAQALGDNTIWTASEYIAQTCTQAAYNADNSCGGTRTQLANWSTFVTHVSTSDQS